MNVYVDDPDPIVRSLVAKYGRNKDLDILVHDPDERVRVAVIANGRDKDLKTLLHDDSPLVVRAVADMAYKKLCQLQAK